MHPQREEYWGNVNPIGTRSCYDEGKRVAETLFFDYFRQKRVDVKVVRIFNTYGPRMRPDDGRVISNFIVQALAGRDITVYGAGRQRRDFCSVDDLIEGMVRMMDYEPDEAVGDGGRADGVSGFPGPVNLGNPHEVTVLTAAQKIIDLVGSPSRIVFKPLPDDDPNRRCPDIGKARAHLDWKPDVPLQTGLERTVAYFTDAAGGRRDRARHGARPVSRPSAAV
jgi:UDP-glucuronate decarboxylase